MTTPQDLQEKLKLGQEKLKQGFEQARRNSRLLVMAGAGLIVVSFLLSWWGIEKYRVKEQRDVQLAVPGKINEIEEKMSPEQKKDYEERKATYKAAWSANRTLNLEFYQWALGSEFEMDLQARENESLKSGQLWLFGWSTWTGRFGFLFVLIGAAWYFAPQFKPELEEYAWTVPWVWTALGAIVLISALAFYFGVPDTNGDGYSQGVTLGCYVALIGALAVVIGGTFEGIKSAQDRLAQLAARAEEEGDDEEADDKPAPRRGAPKAAAVDPVQAAKDEKARRLQDW